jgi:hypothetical protein
MAAVWVMGSSRVRHGNYPLPSRMAVIQEWRHTWHSAMDTNPQITCVIAAWALSWFDTPHKPASTAQTSSLPRDGVISPAACAHMPPYPNVMRKQPTQMTTLAHMAHSSGCADWHPWPLWPDLCTCSCICHASLALLTWAPDCVFH